MSRIKSHWLLIILPVLGIGFWFLLAFPLADRNESYIWIVYLQKYSLIEIIQNPVPSIRNFRPLAQAVTWCLYHLSGGNSLLIQLVNFTLLCAAIWIIIPLTGESKILYARLFYLMIGFIYFSSFYYIFNLHGIFYSPILLVIALLLKEQDGVLRNWKLWLVVSSILAFFHPFILIFYVAYLAGWLVEKQEVVKYRIILLASVALALLVLLKWLIPFQIFSLFNIHNLLGTMRNVETHSIIKVFTLALCLLTLLNKTGKQRVLIVGGIVIYSAIAIIYDLPFLFLLGFLIVLSLVAEKNWSLVALAVAALLLPVVIGSGAPTKASIFIFLLPYILLRPLSFSFDVEEWMPNAIGFATLSVVTCCILFVRVGIEVPVLSSLINPVLVEKGKTFQLEKALMMAQQQAPYKRIQFLQEKQANIRDQGQPKQRDNFPPAKQKEFDAYQRYLLSRHAWNTLPRWYIAFGTEISNDTLVLVSTLQEKNCKPAYIYQPSMFPGSNGMSIKGTASKCYRFSAFGDLMTCGFIFNSSEIGKSKDFGQRFKWKNCEHEF